MHRSARRHRVWGSSTACQWVFSPVGQICRREMGLGGMVVERYTHSFYITKVESRAVN